MRHRFLRHAGLSVFLGRFVAVLRVLAGPMAGAVAMPYRRFLLCNLAGALLWAATMVSVAWLAGQWIPLERLISGVVQFGLGALLLIGLILVLPRLLSRPRGAGWSETATTAQTLAWWIQTPPERPLRPSRLAIRYLTSSCCSASSSRVQPRKAARWRISSWRVLRSRSISSIASSSARFIAAQHLKSTLSITLLPGP